MFRAREAHARSDELAATVVTKPFDIDAVVEMVARLCDASAGSCPADSSDE